MTTEALDDALFLYQHPSWSQRDLDETDQDVLDRLYLLEFEASKITKRNNALAAGRARLTRKR